MLLLITGLPGSGKSTLARAFTARYGGTHINSDLVRGELGLRGSYQPADKMRVYATMLERTRAVLGRGGDALVEGTFYRKDIRQAFEQLASDLGARPIWVEVKASEPTIRRRLQTPRSDSEADFEVYRKIRNQYEPLNTPHLTVWSDKHPPGTLLDAVYRYTLSNHDH